MKNIFTDIPENPAKLNGELLHTILRTPNFRMERIVSRGHRSPEGFWYDQDENEWVFLLKGRAGLRFKDQESPLVLNPGDYLNIHAHRKHRVEWTDANQETIWLVVYYKQS
jgi:cupin 2 domain-containing protein